MTRGMNHLTSMLVHKICWDEQGHRQFAGDSNCLWRGCKTLEIIRIYSEQASEKQKPNINQGLHYPGLSRFRETGMQDLTPLC